MTATPIIPSGAVRNTIVDSETLLSCIIRMVNTVMTRIGICTLTLSWPDAASSTVPPTSML